MQTAKSKNLILNFVAIIAGAQLPLAFAPFNISVIAFISPTLLLALWLYASPKQTFWRGLLYGIGCFGFGVSWVYMSIHIYGNASVPIAALTTGILIMILALFPAVQGYLLTKFFPNNNIGKLLLAFPASWVLFEWSRGWFLSGFPWLFLGYTQLSSPLRGIAPIFGVYGVSFMVALTCGAIIALFTIRKFSLILLVVMITTILWLSSYFLTQIHWTKPQGQPIQISLIQGNTPQEEKWQPSALAKIMDLYQNLTEQNWDSRLIIWPEAAIPAFSWQVQNFLDEIGQEARSHNTSVITGIPIEDQKTDNYYNGMITLGIGSGTYLKRHLVPMGEYPMFAPISKWFMRLFHIPMSSFTPGPKQQTDFIAGNINIAPSICYEVAYPTEILSYLPQAQLLVNVTDDSWFGRSIAAPQQLQMAQMRSLETGRYQLIATNTGITAIVKPDGQLQAKAPMFQQLVLEGKVYAMRGITPWVRFGYYLWLIFAAGFLGFAKLLQLR